MLHNHPKIQNAPSGSPSNIIEYALGIRKKAGIRLRTWTWILNQAGKKCEYGENDWFEDGKTFQQKQQECEQNN